MADSTNGENGNLQMSHRFTSSKVLACLVVVTISLVMAWLLTADLLGRISQARLSKEVPNFETWLFQNPFRLMYVAVICGLWLMPFLLIPGIGGRVKRLAQAYMSVIVPQVEDLGRLALTKSVPLTARRMEELLDLKLEGFKATPVELDPDERATLVSGIAATLAKSLTDESVVALRKSIGATRLTEGVDATKARFADAIQKTANRTRNNLLFGILFSIAAVTMLFFSLRSDALATTSDLLRYFLPRISIVLLVELVAYFFLKLYKSGIEEIRYYQNELTNVEAQSAALEAALLSNDEGLVKAVVTKLASTERNFILPKGSSTVEVEKSRMDHQTTAELIKALGSAISKK